MIDNNLNKICSIFGLNFGSNLKLIEIDSMIKVNERKGSLSRFINISFNKDQSNEMVSDEYWSSIKINHQKVNFKIKYFA